MRKTNTILRFNKFILCVSFTTLFCAQSLYGQWQSTTNYYLDFDQSSTDEHITMNRPSVSGAFTMETWVLTKNKSCSSNSKPTSNDAFVSMADHDGTHGGNFKGAEIGVNACGNNMSDRVAGGTACRFYFAVGSGSSKAIVSSTFAPSCNTWHHVAGVYTGTQIKLYVNGVLQNTVNYSGSITWPSTTGGMTLGREAKNPSAQEGYLDGSLDNVAIWNTAKDYSNTSTASNYYKNPISPTATDLVDHYHFNQNDRTKNDPVKDATSGNDGSQTWKSGTAATNNNFVDYVGHTTSTGPPLPVEILNFELVQDNESVDLFWSTASELNNHFFTLEKSMDGRHWNLLGTVEGNGTTNEISDYTYTDYNPYPIQTYYRLAQTDYDGKFEYLAVKSTNSNDEGISQMSVRPNPSSDFVNIDYVQFPYSQIRFLNAQGIDVSKEIKVLRNTGNSLMLDISAIQNGVYSVVSPTSSALLIKF